MLKPRNAYITPLVPVTIASVYKGKLPRRMALCTPDTAAGLRNIVQDLRSLGYELRVSDLFRSHEMQKRAHEDYLRRRKNVYSPPPGSSMHEAGRAVDVDLSSVGVPLAKFWEIARAHGFYPVVERPDPALKEAWHFDCRGSHHAVYEHSKKSRGVGQAGPYPQMARSAILAIGVPLESLPDRDVAFLQSALIRLGFDPGPIDGRLGPRTRAALREAGCPDPEGAAACLGERLRAAFPLEFPAEPEPAAP